MRELSLEELHAVEMDIMIRFTRFCDNNDLRYYLAYGSLLGAVRHRGFIPWDDDMDVWMPRPDYERFCELYPRTDEVDPYLVKPDESQSFWLTAKLMDRSTLFTEPRVGLQKNYGVFIDIFPIDGVEEGKSGISPYSLVTWWIRIYAYAYCLDASRLNASFKDWIKRVLGRIGRLKKRQWYIDKLHHLTTRYSFDESKAVVSFASPYPYAREAGPREDYLGNARLPFEGHNLRVPRNYEAVLERIYGPNWRTPMRQENGGHGKAYWRDEPQVEQTKTQ